MRILARVLRWLRRELVSRPLPHGLLGWQYLWPSDDDRILLHRQLWWSGPSRWPRPLWLLVELWLWLRWVGFDAWRASWRAVRHFGPRVRTDESIRLRQQAWRVLSLSLVWCIPPFEVYRFRLYRKSARPLDYVFEHEIAAYHRWRSRPLGLTSASLMLLQDKLALATELTAAGLPMAPTLACLPRGQPAELGDWLEDQVPVFCKTRSGSAAVGAFTAWWEPRGLCGRMFDGRPLKTTAAVEQAWHRLLNLDDVLVQPRLKNHPDLQALAIGDDAITVRFISQRNGSRHDGRGSECLSATLEIPAGHDPRTGGPYYVILPIDAAGGRLLPWSHDDLIEEESRWRDARVNAMLTPESVVPEWTRLADYSLLAHQRFPDVWGIAWDWVVTPEGPQLLEGNSSWSATTLQMLSGGLLAGQ